jgi:hypothetical protein
MNWVINNYFEIDDNPDLLNIHFEEFLNIILKSCNQVLHWIAYADMFRRIRGQSLPKFKPNLPNLPNLT